MDTIDMVEELKILDEVTIFDTNAHYVIPRYQRAYAWEDKEIVQLIDDINDIDSSENYYIGSLVVSKIQGKAETYEVVDGQQRLTTLFLLLQYLVSEGVLEGEVGQTLTFDCRSKSKYTLSNIQQILTNKKLSADQEESIDQSILNGIKAIRQKFTSDKGLNKDEFVSRLQHVILYRIEVPEHTDLNRYFEIMNTRGEQLEQHDILKARLMRFLNNRKEQELFSRIWNACSDMTGYVQMHFSRTERKKFFNGEGNNKPADKWDEYRDCLDITEDSETNATISEIIKPRFKVDNVDGILDDDTHIRFESIIEFPHFLLHALRVFVKLKLYDVSLKKDLGDLLDDKKLIADFENVIKHGTIDDEPIKDNRENFAKMFIIHLLQTRYLFDKFIIKREFTGEDKEGEWSLKELHTSGQSSKTYYSNTRLRHENEWETYAPRNKECLMIQSALRVSYTSPKVMHWITNLIQWLFEDNKIAELTNEAEAIAARAIMENFLKGREDYKLGVTTPHIVFNFLDYLLWKNNKNIYSDFEFEFRNSVEHWYPQNPSDGSFDSWDDKDTFGNLCIISRSVNSKFSNLSPESKMKSYSKMVKKGSLKLRIMGDIIEKGSNDKWIKSQCREHEEEMIEILKEACSNI